MSPSRKHLGIGLVLLSLGASPLSPQEATRPTNWPAPPLWIIRQLDHGPRSTCDRMARARREPRAEKQALGSDVAHALRLHQSPCRILDTRVTGGPIASGFTRDANLTGAPCGIPSTAAAVSANFAVFNIIGAARQRRPEGLAHGLPLHVPGPHQLVADGRADR